MNKRRDRPYPIGPYLFECYVVSVATHEGRGTQREVSPYYSWLIQKENGGGEWAITSVVDLDSLNPDPDTDPVPAFQVNPVPDTDPRF